VSKRRTTLRTWHRSLRQRVAFEELVTGLSTRFVNVAATAIDDELNAALGAIGAFAGVDRAYLFRFSPDGKLMVNTHEWCAPGIEPQIQNLQALPLTEVPWWSAGIKAGRVIHVADVDLLPDEAAAERAVLADQGVQSVLAIPMVQRDAVLGFVGFDAVRRPKAWPKADIALLRIAGEIFMGALERARAERERAELEARLLQARSLENVARLAGGVAHDFNNLLAIILNYAELLKREIADPSQRAKLDELVETAQRAATLTRQLLRVGRREVVAPVPLDVSAVVRSLQRLLEQTLGDDVTLRLLLDDHLDVVEMGRPQLEQVVVNLVLNARDALPRGGAITICTENADISPAQAARTIDFVPGRFVRLQISDDGAGMPPEIASRAFEPFFTTKGTLGTGLGLSSVHGIVKQAGGQIAISSYVGRGTTVDVYLRASQAGAALPEPPRSPRLVGAPTGRGETILVVDDSSAIRKLVCQHLAEAGYQPIEAGTPEDAIAIASAKRGAIDLLLTDVIMPHMTGPDLAAHLAERLGVTRVLYMSGYDDDLIGRHGVVGEGTRLLSKPFLPGELLAAVRGCFA
jgi:signal transduction histidine kinase